MVKKLIMSLDLSRASGPDCILAVVLKNCEPELAYILAELFNKWVFFPDCWKVSSVVPVFENVGKRSAAKNYCPASLLYVVSRVFEKLVNNRIVNLLLFPNFQTADFQVLDLTVIKWVKGIMMHKFNKWFAETLRKELDVGKSLDEISIKFKLMAMKPLHVKWVINLFNQLSSFERKKVILAGWKASGILNALERGLAGFSGSFTDLYYKIDPFGQGEVHFNITHQK